MLKNIQDSDSKLRKVEQTFERVQAESGDYGKTKLNLEELKGTIKNFLDRFSGNGGNSGNSGSTSSQFLENTNYFLNDLWNHILNIIQLNSEIYHSLSENGLWYIWAYGNMFGNIFILLAMISISSLLYGDHIIKKYNLKDKHWILTKIINFRTIFKNYTLAFNIFVIFLMLFLLLFCNLFPFIYKYF